jgi:hypothetical protein
MVYSRVSAQSLCRTSSTWTFPGLADAGLTCLPSFSLLKQSWLRISLTCPVSAYREVRIVIGSMAQHGPSVTYGDCVGINRPHFHGARNGRHSPVSVFTAVATAAARPHGTRITGVIVNRIVCSGPNAWDDSLKFGAEQYRSYLTRYQQAGFTISDTRFSPARPCRHCQI